MIRALKRFYLGVLPHGFVGSPDDTLVEGIKEAVCLNVAAADEVARRLYMRCGFFLGDELDPKTVRKGFHVSILTALGRVTEAK